jgi:hypothetical protein
MPDLNITAVKGVAMIHHRSYPMYTAFMTPAQLIEFSSVPSFARRATHVSLSTALEEGEIDDAWQRPLDVERIGRIKTNIDRATAANNDNDCLMANPVLVGRSNNAGEKHEPTTVFAEQITDSNGTLIQDVFDLTIKMSGDEKPLWILDGQHRIHGMGDSPFDAMSGSILENQVIPVVFVIDDQYKPDFLAKIFTEVTTEAVKMHELHGDWMQYSFEMADYRTENAREAFKVVLQLNNHSILGGVANPFHEKIQFNPNLLKPPVSTDQIISLGYIRADSLREFICLRYHAMGGNLGSEEVASAITNFLTASVQLDGFSTGDSRLFGTVQPHQSLAYEYLGKFLTHIAGNPGIINNSVNEWKDFLEHSDRLFQHCDWRLPLIGNSSTTGTAYGPSKHAAERTFHHFFETPTAFGGLTPSDYLVGPGPVKFQYTESTAANQFNPNAFEEAIIQANNGGHTMNIRGQSYDIVRIKPEPSQHVSVMQVYVMTGGNWIQQQTAQGGILLPNAGTGPQTLRIQVHTMAYGEDSKKKDTIDILYD